MIDEEIQAEQAEEIAGEAPVEETGEEETGETPEETGEEEEATPATEEKKTVPIKAVLEERRKRQALEDEIRKLKEEQQAKQPTPQKPVEQKTLYEHYDDNPKAVTDWINGEIARLTNEDPYENALQIENLRDQKAELKLYGQQRQVTKQNTFIAELNKAIPNITDRAPKLIQFAQTELGYTPEDINALTNPNLVGEAMAIKNTKMINRLYEAAHPEGKEAPVKRITQAPAPINPVGGKSNTEPDPSKMSDDEWHAYERDRLKKQGRLY